MAKKTPLADVLAKELGFKDAKHLKENLAARRGGDFSENVKGRLTEGQGFKESFGGAIKDKITDVKETFSKKGLKKFAKNAYNTFFGGDDIFSAYMRGKLAKKGEDKDSLEPEKMSGDLSGANGMTGEALQESNAVLSIIAKESLSLSGMARDMNVMRQNIVKLVKLENQDKEEGDEHKAVGKADAFFLKEDEREAKLEASKQKLMPKPAEKEEKPKEEEGGGILESIMGFFSDGFLSSFKSLFNPMAILKVIGKVFVIGTILISLFKGITAAFDKWKETGSIKEAIIAGLGAIVDFLTFGIFGEDTVKNLFDSVGSFLDPIITSVSGVITSIKDWIANNVGIPEIKLGSITAPSWLGGGTFDFGTVGPYYPFKKDPTSTKPEVSAPTAVGSAPPATPAKTGAPKKTDSASSETTDASSQGKPIPIPEPASPSKESNSLFNRAYLESVASGDNPRPLISPERAKDILKTMDEADKESPQPAAPSPMPAVGAQPQAAGSGGGSGGGGSSGGSSGGGTGGTVSAAGGASESPTGATTAPSPGESTSAPSGSELSKQSSEVAEAQRMESAADQGSVVNAPTTNNTTGSQGKKPPTPIADVYNTEFVNAYFPTF